MSEEQHVADNGQNFGAAAQTSFASGMDTSKWAKSGFGQGNSKISGKFSKEESEVVRRAVEEFCTRKQISVARLCSECDHKAELKGAWMEIAKQLPHRSVQSVYRHGLRQLHPFRRGAWTDDECEMLVSLVTRMGKKWAAIQVKLNRSADSCRDKYREMGDSYVRGRWKDNETEILKRLIRKHLSADPNADIKELGKMVEAEGIKIPWGSISKQMGKRSRLSCFKKWQKMTGLFSPSDQYKGGDQPLSNEKSADSTEAVAQEGAHTTTAAEKEVSARSTKPTPPTHAAPTAGAAAALAANVVVNNPIASDNTGSSGADFDLYLLSEIVSLGASRTDEIEWDNIRFDNAEERWNEIFEEWQSTVNDDSLLSLPVSEIAQMILDRKTSAQRAAETVEAVDLPNPRSLEI